MKDRKQTGGSLVREWLGNPQVIQHIFTVAINHEHQLVTKSQNYVKKRHQGQLVNKSLFYLFRWETLHFWWGSLFTSFVKLATLVSPVFRTRANELILTITTEQTLYQRILSISSHGAKMAAQMPLNPPPPSSNPAPYHRPLPVDVQPLPSLPLLLLFAVPSHHTALPLWYVSNVSIILDVPCMYYINCHIFYMHFISYYDIYWTNLLIVAKVHNVLVLHFDV